MTGLVAFAVQLSLAVLASWLEARHDRSENRGLRQGNAVANMALALINGALLSSVPLGAVSAGLLAQERGFGLLNWFQPPGAVIVIASVALLTLTPYVTHRLLHEVPFFWRFHRVHHCAPLLDGTTGFRTHPGEAFLALAVLLPVVLLFGVDPAVVMVLAILDTSAAILTHTGLRLPPRWERVVNMVLVTPAVHAIHHSDDARETDTNYGTLITLWDRLFGTFRARPLRAEADFKLGLRDVSPAESGDLDVLLRLPLRPLRRRVQKR